MFSPFRAMLALVPLLAVSACDDDDDVAGLGSNTATVRFVNAAILNIDVRNAGTVVSGNVAFGGNSSCMTVNTSGASGTGLVFNEPGSTTTVPGFTQSFTAGGNYTVVAYPSSTGTRFATLDNGGFTPIGGQAGLRVFNAVATLGNVVALSNGTAIGAGTGVSYGNAGAFMNVNAGLQPITFNTGAGTATVASAGNVNFTAGQKYTLIVAPPPTGSITLRTVLVPVC
jgi:hypothetical protein